MRITEDTRFPHPVLVNGTHDFASGEFEVAFRAEEKPRTGALALDYEISLTEGSIAGLLSSEDAIVGCFVRCEDTYYTELRRLSWPRGRMDFLPGALINRVTLRPFIWLARDIREWDPGTIHQEFAPPVSLSLGDIVAIGPESVLSVGQAKFASLESIFQLDVSEDLPEGVLRVDPEADRITLLVAPKLYQTINTLRGQADRGAIVVNAVYLPAIMEVLDLLQAGREQYEGRRWYQPFVAKCDAKAIDLAETGSLLEKAQRLLDSPMRALSKLVSEDEA